MAWWDFHPLHVNLGFSPIHAIAGAAKDVLHGTLFGATGPRGDAANQNADPGGLGLGAKSPSPLNKAARDAGITSPTQADPKSKSDPAPSSTPQSTPFEQIINPLAYQMWYAQTLGPLLNQVYQQQQGDISEYQTQMADSLTPAERSSMSPGTLAALDAGTKNNVAAMKNTANAEEAGAAWAPAMDHFTNLLQTAVGSQSTLQAEIARALSESLLTGGGLTPNPLQGLPGQNTNPAQNTGGIAPSTPSGGIPSPAQIAALLGTASMPGQTSPYAPTPTG